MVRLAISQYEVIRGMALCIPRMAINIRVFVRSYSMLARQNSIEEVRPWAIIKMTAPEVLQGV